MAKKFLFRCDNVTLIYDNFVFKLYTVYRDSYLLEQNVVWKLLERMTRRGQKTLQIIYWKFFEQTFFWKIRPTSDKPQTKHRRSSIYFKNGTSIANRSAITRANFDRRVASRRVAVAHARRVFAV